MAILLPGPAPAGMASTSTVATVANMPKKCFYCERSFSKMEHLHRHQRSHTGERPFKCVYCLKRYARSDVLMRHVRINHPHKPQNPRRTSSVTHRLGEGDGKDEREDSSNSPKSPRSTGREQGETITVDMPVSSPTVSLPETSPMTPCQTTFEPNQLNDRDQDCNTDSLPSPGSPDIMANISDSTYPLPDMSSSWNQGHDTADFYPSPPTTRQKERQETGTLEQRQRDQQTLSDLCSPRLQLAIDDIDLWGDGVMVDDFMDLVDPRFFTPGTNHYSSSAAPTIENHHHLFSESVIPRERFSKVQRLWPSGMTPAPRLIRQLWKDVALHKSQSIFTDPDYTASYSGLIDPGLVYPGVDEECRKKLIRECITPTLTDSLPSPAQSGPNGDTDLNEVSSNPSNNSLASSGHSMISNLPSVELLDVALYSFFRKFTPVFGFIHQHTFNASSTPASLLFPVVLIGLTILDSGRVKKFVQAHFPKAVQRCRQEISARLLRQCQTPELLTTLASSVLLLYLGMENRETVLETHTQMLYIETISLAQRHGLFAAQDGQTINIELLKHANNETEFWKTWARTESSKRLITWLVIYDCCYSNLLETSPVMRVEVTSFLLPCEDILFEAPTAAKWVEISNSGIEITTLPVSIKQGASHLPPKITSMGFLGVLALNGLQIIEAEHSLLFLSSPDGTPKQSLSSRLRATKFQEMHIASILIKLAKLYSPIFHTMDTRFAIHWHSQCLSLTVDKAMLHLAAGSGGAERASEALDDVAAWSQLPSARRACLHAAHIFFILSQLTFSDITLYYLESMLFDAALVLGLYLLMIPSVENDQILAVTPLELLQDIDWKAVAGEGLLPPDPTRSSTCEATTFIREGGIISFSGFVHRGGYGSARRVLLDYITLLEKAGKWQARDYSRILRIMSNSFFDVDKAGSE